MKQAIIVSANTAAIGVVRALGTMGVPVVMLHYNNSEDIAQVSKYVVEKIKAPHPEDSEADFLARLIECADRHAGSLLIPVSDESVSIVAKYKEVLEHYYIVACVEEKIARQFIDKKHTYALAERVGVPVPNTIVPKTIDDVERYGKVACYPCLIKPCHSHRFHASFKRKVFLAHNLDEMVSLYRKVADEGLEILLQEIIPGDDTHGVNYNSYIWDGRPLVEFTSAKLRHAPPRFGYPCAVVSRDVPDVVESGRVILKAMRYYGYANVEFKKDPRDGVYKLFEVNGRHNLSSLLAVRCGINFPWLQYKHLVKGELPQSSRYSEDVYWLDPFKDIGYGIKYFRQEQYSISQIIQPYFKPRVFASLDFKDPKPTLWRVMHLVRRKSSQTSRALFTRPLRRLLRALRKSAPG